LLQGMDTSGHLPYPNVALRERSKCVCHISKHSSVVAVLEGIRGALIQTRAVKSVRGPPSRTYYLGTSIGSFVHAADELHHAAPRERAMRTSLPSEERSTGAYGNAVAREKSLYSSVDVFGVTVELCGELPVVRLLLKHACDLYQQKI
jgi:hypothetical protein